MPKKLKKLNKLVGEVPLIYKRSTIYTMCILINALVDAVNYLGDEVERLSNPAKDGDPDA